MFTDHGKVLALNFLEMVNAIFFLSKMLMWDYIFFGMEHHFYRLLESSCFKLFALEMGNIVFF